MAAGLINEIDHGPWEKTGQDGGGGAAAPEPSPRGSEDKAEGKCFLYVNYNWQGETKDIYGYRNRQ